MASAKRVTRKELLKGEDEFMTFSARAVLFAQEHSRQLQIAGVVIGVAILLYLGGYAYLTHVESKGQAAYNEAYYTLDETLYGKQEPDKLKQVEALFRRVTEQYGLSKASRLAYPELAHLKFQEKKYDEALSLYQNFLEESPQDSPYRPLAMLAMAACHEEKGELEKAAEMLRGLLSHPQGAFKDLAMLNLARVYRLNGQEDRAKETLKEFASRFKGSPFLPMVNAFLKKDAT
ncbi:MAG: tetratricopeptide repeat protein [Deltaproteobacteria bacterium]|nr:tetratricopeptide repeat protein [Deltaproteobacteria bacterium]